LKAAISVLADGPGERWLVLGDMGELGGDAAALHREMGLVAKRAEIDHLYTVGRLSLGASDVFGQGAKHFEDRETLIGELRKSLTDNATVLVKGSRAMEMELVVEALCDRGAEQC
jgi:UDP-N-acetylmuramoyl-tripeptide--D-alanyl-D-alanine ligase